MAGCLCLRASVPGSCLSPSPFCKSFNMPFAYPIDSLAAHPFFPSCCTDSLCQLLVVAPLSFSRFSAWSFFRRDFFLPPRTVALNMLFLQLLDLFYFCTSWRRLIRIQAALLGSKARLPLVCSQFSPFSWAPACSLTSFRVLGGSLVHLLLVWTYGLLCVFFFFLMKSPFFMIPLYLLTLNV